MHTVHVRVNDAGTGRPTPVRLALRDATGTYRAPLGRLVDFATGPGEDVGGNVRLGPARYAHIDGACEVRLPPGTIVVEVSKGPEYRAIAREVALGPGQISLRLTMERWADLTAQGWYAGDIRAHEMSVHAAILEGAAEGLALVHLLSHERPPAGGKPAAVPGLLGFSGDRPALEGQDCSVVVNTLNAHPVLGTVGLLNCHRPVFPLRFGEPGLEDDWSVSDWCDQCHRKTGLVTWPDVPRLTAACPQGEALAAAVLGKIDAFEVAGFPEPEPAALGDWYRLLDCGLRLPLVGGSGKDSNAVVLGSVRTYARLTPGEKLSPGPWAEAVRAGRTFITNGPLLSLTVAGEGPGAVLPCADKKAVQVRAEARSAVPFDQLEVLAGGIVVGAKPASGNRLAAVLEQELTVNEPTWIAARCWGAGPLLPGAGGPCTYAHTSPVYIAIEGHRHRADRATVNPLLEVLERALAWVAREAKCPTEQHRGALAATIQAARDELTRRAAP